MQITNRRKFRAVFLAALLIVVAIVWLTWGGSTLKNSGDIVIAEGDVAQAVWDKVVAGGFTRTTLPWRFHSWRLGAASQLKVGSYRLEKDERVAEVVARMVAGDAIPDELRLTFPEGFTLEQMAARTSAKGIGTVDEFITQANILGFQEQYAFLQELPATRDLEGYLFPDTYQVYDDDSPRDVITRQLTNFDNKLTSDLRDEAVAGGRTLDQVVIMASIIEREVISDEDMAVISGILWKRFDESIGLDADATIRYAVKKWDGALTVQDLQIDSPYNTRRYRGLPPGPISNPGMRALVAAVRPEESEYYYYLSAPDGTTYFARTNDEHNANKAKYLR